MRFKLDENVTADGADALAAAGFDAMTVGRQGMGGWADGRIRAAVASEGRTLITADLDFSDLRAARASSPGIVLLRLPRQSRAAQIDALARLSAALKAGLEARGRLIVVEAARIRIRDGA